LIVNVIKATHDLHEKEKEQARRPALTLSRPWPGYADQSNTRRRDGSIHPGRARCLRVSVTNAPGKRVAKNCRAFLVGILRIEPGGKTQEMLPNDPRQLEWMHGEFRPETRDINPGAGYQIDLLAACEGQKALEVAAHPLVALDQPGQYVFSVHLTADDIDPKGIEVNVCWGGTPDSLRPGDVRLFDPCETTTAR
jgi:hypothetical protein